MTFTETLEDAVRGQEEIVRLAKSAGLTDHEALARGLANVYRGMIVLSIRLDKLEAKQQ